MITTKFYCIQNLSFPGLFSTADPDNANQPTNRQSFTYKLMGNTAGLPLVIDGNALNSTSSLDYEAHSSWNITVQSVDSGDPPLSVVKDFHISVIGKSHVPVKETLAPIYTSVCIGAKKGQKKTLKTTPHFEGLAFCKSLIEAQIGRSVANVFKIIPKQTRLVDNKLLYFLRINPRTNIKFVA